MLGPALRLGTVAALVSTTRVSQCDPELRVYTQGDFKVKIRAKGSGTAEGEKKRDFSKFLIVGGTANTSLSNDVCKLLGTAVAPVDVTRFSDGEVCCVINESVRGKDVYLIQSFGSPVNDNIMELLLTITALRRSGAGNITAVIPYYGYKFHRNRGMPISTTMQSRFLWNAAGDVAKMLSVCGVDKVLSVDLQRPGQNQEAAFFPGHIPVETIDSNSLFVNHFASSSGPEGSLIKDGDKFVVLSPNTEFVKKAKRFQRKLQGRLNNKGIQAEVGYAAFLEDELNDNDIIPLDPAKPAIKFSDFDALLGDVRGADVIIIDDIVESGLGLSQLCRRLVRAGAKRIYVCASHGLFSKNSMQLIDLSMVEKVIVTDSLPLPKDTPASPKIVQLSVAPLLSKVIETELLQHSNKEAIRPVREDDDLLSEEDEDGDADAEADASAFGK
jgi:ribose-phosphate pyrophosphokinase